MTAPGTQSTPVPAPSPVEDGPREVLLRAVVGYAQRHGLTDVSLRSLAGAVGTSHRMLLYHFGSREGLMAAVVAAVEAQQRVSMTAFAQASSGDPADTMRMMWAGLADPAMHESERLFFDSVALALRGRPGTDGLRATLVEPWLDAVEDAARVVGLPAGPTRLDARIGMALVRGLLLDLLATGDREGVDAAVEHFIARWLPPSPVAPSPVAPSPVAPGPADTA